MSPADPYYVPQSTSCGWATNLTWLCGVCEKRKRKNLFSERALHLGNGPPDCKCDTCAERERELSRPDRLVEFHATWTERVRRGAEYAPDDRIDGLAVSRVDELEPDLPGSEPELRVWMKEWPEDGPVPPPRDPEKLRQIREARRKKAGRK